MSTILNSRQDKLSLYLQQLEALIDVITSIGIDPTELKSATLPTYFWIMDEVLQKVKNQL